MFNLGNDYLQTCKSSCKTVFHAIISSLLVGGATHTENGSQSVTPLLLNDCGSHWSSYPTIATTVFSFSHFLAKITIFLWLTLTFKNVTGKKSIKDETRRELSSSVGIITFPSTLK